jgi:hypothetical protein
MAEARRRRHRRLAGAPRGGAGSRRCPGGGGSGRPGFARPAERRPRPSGYRAGGRHQLGGERRRGRLDQRTRARRRWGRSHGGAGGRRRAGGPALIRRRAKNHGSGRRRSRPRGAHAAQLFGAPRRRRRRQHAGPTAAGPHPGRPARPDGRPGPRDRRITAGARRARHWRSSRQGPGLPTQAVAVSTACRYSFHTSTETSSTGRGIGGSGLAALTRTLSAP